VTVVRVRMLTIVLAILAAGAAAPARAQSLSDVLTFLVTNDSVPTGNAQRDRDAALAAGATISRALLANLATLPVPSSSAAFVYRLNPEIGTVERGTQTFGPFFLERALTPGRGQVSAGFTVQHLHFTSLDGRSLTDGSLVTTANQFRDEAAPFDVDRLTLKLDADVATLFASVGVTDNFELGVAAPAISLTIDGSRVETYRGRTFTQAAASGHAVGLADMVVRGKYTVYHDQTAALAAAVDVRLPTGRQRDLLGAGTTSYKVSTIGSLEGRRAAAHANLALTVGGLATEFSYGAALSLAATSSLSIGGEVLGRWIDGAGQLVSTMAPHPLLTGVDTIRLSGDNSSLQIVTVVPGFKWNIADTWVLSANVSVPLTDDGLTARFTPFIGLEYALGR